MEIIEISVPEYTIKKKPDYVKIGKKVDKVIGKAFPDGKYILRSIGVDDHPNLSLNELVDIIAKTGTDKYDPKRKAVCHDEFSGYDYDIQAGEIKIKNSKLVITKDDSEGTVFGTIAKKFFENVILDRGYRVRIDILMFYDPTKLVLAKKRKGKSIRKELAECLYKFKGEKKDALIGIVKILRK